MSNQEKEVEEQLFEAGNKLLSPPSSVPELLSALDRVENLLSSVEQSPSETMKEALAPSTKALIAQNLVRHSDVDVKVAVASCISEITRITAPDAPYEDEEMKEVFKLIVSSFENLNNKSSRSYAKRTSILETVAKVRSCVVMLDLECDALIVDMFRHFFRSIRDDLHENVFLSMETIMTLVVEESEEISPELLSSILDVLKRENKEVPPVARQLGESVIAKCASKLKPYLLPAVRSSGASLDDFVKAVTDVCQEGSEAVEVTDGDSVGRNLADEDELVNAPSEKAVEVGMKTLKDAPPSEEAGASTVGSPKTVMGNGTLQKDNENISPGNDNSKDAVHDVQSEEAEPSNTNVGSVETEEPTKSQSKPGRSNRRKGRKPHSSKSSEPSESSALGRKLEAVKSPDRQENDTKDVDPKKDEDLVADTTVPVENEKTPEALLSPPKASDNELATVPSQTLDGNHADETSSKKVGRGKKNEDLVQAAERVNEDSRKESDNKKASEKDGGSENKSNKRTSKKSSHAPEQEESAPVSTDEKKEDDDTDVLDGESAKDLNEKTEVEGSRREDQKKRGHAKATEGKGQTRSKDEKKKTVALPKSSSKLAGKSDSDVEEAPKSNSKRKRSDKEKPPQNKVYGAELIGSTVEVWWPDDDKYYKGVVGSYDAAKKKHKVLYDDGDIEVLNLKNEKWMLIDGPREQKGDGESPDESADEVPKGKKTKASADVGAKHGKTVSPSKKSGASSSKSKATPKTVSKQKDDGKKSNKSTEEPSSNSGADKGGKSKVSKSGNKSPDDTLKSAKKSKDSDADTTKSSSKSKQEISKSAGKSKGKSGKTVGKSTPNTSVKVKAPALPIEESEDESESLEHERTPEKSKGKSQSTEKSQKNSKKRKRSVKG